LVTAAHQRPKCTTTAVKNVPWKSSTRLRSSPPGVGSRGPLVGGNGWRRPSGFRPGPPHLGGVAVRIHNEPDPRFAADGLRSI
jgi:hypothetical protein